MPDSLPAHRDPEESSGESGREARIEELLLAGLDQYFSGHHEQAITIWTRVEFLERGHPRARACIERARRALAEGQRDAEESIARGGAACDDGDFPTARVWLDRALARGGATDAALVLEHRLHRLDAGAQGTGPLRLALDVQPAPAARAEAWMWVRTGAAACALAAGILGASIPVTSWLAARPVPVATPRALVGETLPIVRPSMLVVDRARRLAQDGRRTEALRLLDTVDLADPLRPSADRLRTAVQHALLAAVDTPSAESAATARSETTAQAQAGGGSARR